MLAALADALRAPGQLGGREALGSLLARRRRLGAREPRPGLDPGGGLEHDPREAAGGHRLKRRRIGGLAALVIGLGERREVGVVGIALARRRDRLRHEDVDVAGLAELACEGRSSPLTSSSRSSATALLKIDIAARRRRIATRIWCTASGSAPRATAVRSRGDGRGRSGRSPGRPPRRHARAERGGFRLDRLAGLASRSVAPLGLGA